MNFRNNESKKLIVRLMRDYYEQLNRALLDAHVNRAAAIASANTWDDFNKDDGVGGFSTNPYSGQLNQVDQRVEQARIALAKAKDAYDFAVDTFVEETDAK